MTEGGTAGTLGPTMRVQERLRLIGFCTETLAIIRDGWERWITADHANNPKYLIPEGRIQHEAASSHAIDHLCEGCAKFAEIEKMLETAIADGSGPAEWFGYPLDDKSWEGTKGPIKKHVVFVLFASRSRDLCTRTGIGPTAGTYASSSPPKPRAGVMGICGEGVNGMQKACCSVSVDLPFSEALRTQIRGRTFRYSQVHASNHYELVSLHPAERAILARHEKRDEEFQRILVGPAGDTGKFAGGGLEL
ncbi:hypothetical protein VTK26DRAFT_2137 [Humicola hyalothermophila]